MGSKGVMGEAMRRKGDSYCFCQHQNDPCQKLLEVILTPGERECKVVQQIRTGQGLGLETTDCLLPIPFTQKGGHAMNVTSQP